MQRVFNISSNLSFLDSLAQGVLEKFPDLQNLTIFLPTKRAIRPLAEAFLKHSKKDVLVLPKIEALGEVDEDEISLEFNQDFAELPEEIPQIKRIYLLAKLIFQNRDKIEISMPSFNNCISLAKSLAGLLDELQNKDINYKNLQTMAVVGELAQHWELTYNFLQLILEKWEVYLAENNYLEPVARRNKLLGELTNYYRSGANKNPVLIAGTTASVPATLKLVKAILESGNGYLVLDGLDRNLSQDDFRILEETHPQYNLAQLLNKLELYADDVLEWQKTELTERQKIISTILYPSAKTAEWQDKEFNGANLTQIDCENLEEEAAVISVLLREGLEDAKKTAMVVTNNRPLAARIASKMSVWGVEVNDSAGQVLLNTPPARFLIQLAEMAISDNAPLESLSFFKHPFVNYETKEKARAIELKFLRKDLRDDDSFTSFKDKGLSLPEYEPFYQIIKQGEAVLADVLRLHLAAAEAIAGDEKLYDKPEEFAEFLEEFQNSIDADFIINTKHYAEILESFLGGKTFRPKFGSHPRINILSPIEARLIQANTVILAGMNEGSFPLIPPADSFMNQQIRKNIGLDLLSQKIGKSAHDFELLSQADKVFYTRSNKEGGSPTVESRFLKRLKAITKIDAGEKYTQFAEKIFYPKLEAKPCERPMPNPPIEARPKKLSATKIGRLMRDPYIIYASEILKLKKPKDIDAELTPADFGNIIHKALEDFNNSYDENLSDAEQTKQLIEYAKPAFEKIIDKQSVQAFWLPKFYRITTWYVQNERKIREVAAQRYFEHEGKINIKGVDITTKADRVEVTDTIKIIDYKTGTAPSPTKVKNGIEPQLSVEAIIFEVVFGKLVADAEYWKLNGDEEDMNKPTSFAKDIENIVADAREGLDNLIGLFNQPNAKYIAQPWTKFAIEYNDYEHLERIKEWEQ